MESVQSGCLISSTFLLENLVKVSPKATAHPASHLTAEPPGEGQAMLHHWRGGGAVAQLHLLTVFKEITCGMGIRVQYALNKKCKDEQKRLLIVSL